ncbi:MAG: hypothetical protein HOP13_20190 [Alphaproteobacteria bacterium]|nr:hypothetical protein [Alphaproteobacteria bacterium]
MILFKAFGLVAAGSLGCAAAFADDIRKLPPDEPVVVNGFDLVCTGVGEDARNDPRWTAYPVRIEFANADAQYLSDAVLAVAKADGEQLFEVTCDSPWVLANLEPGKYVLAATYEGIVKTEKFTAPKSGQARFVVRFAEVPGDRPN